MPRPRLVRWKPDLTICATFEKEEEMFSHKKWARLFALAIVASMVLSACATPTPEVIEKIVTQVVTQVVKETVKETVVVEGTPQVIEKEVTKVVEKEVTSVVEKVVTPTPVPLDLNAPDPTTLTWVSHGDISSMDPHLAYEDTSFHLINNIIEGLIYFNRESASEFVPWLATEVPSVKNGGISEDGMTYTFHIRPGIKFHNGNDLTASDVAYSWQRGLLQSDPNSG
jgi:peptide/nickel transport system substrate-binding protein